MSRKGNKPVAQFDVEEDVFAASHHVEFFRRQHDLFDLARCGAQDHDFSYWTSEEEEQSHHAKRENKKRET
jgi:hypothetical protein